MSKNERKGLGDMAINALPFDVPLVVELMKSLSEKIITLFAKDCGYS